MKGRKGAGEKGRLAFSPFLLVTLSPFPMDSTRNKTNLSNVPVVVA
jgi:hypothetical protein